METDEVIEEVIQESPIEEVPTESFNDTFEEYTMKYDAENLFDIGEEEE